MEETCHIYNQIIGLFKSGNKLRSCLSARFKPSRQFLSFPEEQCPWSVY